MANAARDPVFWAAVAIARQDQVADSSGLLDGATQLCIRCHSPRAVLEGNANATTMAELTVTQREGVECEVCHRAIDDGITPAGNAGFVLDDQLVGDEVPRRGPWDYDDDGLESQRPDHPTINDPYIATSRLCGTCHDVTTVRERVDAAGQGMGMAFNEQRTYSEWLGSVYAQPGDMQKSCQDCHMPRISDAAGCVKFYENQPPTLHATGARTHDLVGANRFMLTLLRQIYGGAEVPAEHFDLTIERMDAMLRRSASLEVSVPDVIDLRRGIEGLHVKVINRSGHKLPSGYSEGREMWIEVTVAQSYGGQLIYSSGRWNDGIGHDNDRQLRLYNAIAEDSRTGAREHLLLNDRWLVDTRIPPLGLRPAIDTDPVGDRYQLQPDGTWPNFDIARYDFPPRTDVHDPTPESDLDFVDVRIRLLYLINTRAYIESLRVGNHTNGAGQYVSDLFESAGHATPVELAHVLRRLPLRGLVGQPQVDQSGSSSGSGDTTTGPSTTTGTDTQGTTGPETSETDLGSGSGSGKRDHHDPEGCQLAAKSTMNWPGWWLAAAFVRRHAGSRQSGHSH